VKLKDRAGAGALQGRRDAPCFLIHGPNSDLEINSPNLLVAELEAEQSRHYLRECAGPPRHARRGRCHGTPPFSETRLWICRRRRRIRRERTGSTACAASARRERAATPSNEDARPAVTTGDEVEHLKPEEVRHRGWGRRHWGWRRRHWGWRRRRHWGWRRRHWGWRRRHWGWRRRHWRRRYWRRRYW